MCHTSFLPDSASMAFVNAPVRFAVSRSMAPAVTSSLVLTFRLTHVSPLKVLLVLTMLNLPDARRMTKKVWTASQPGEDSNLTRR